MNNTVFNAILNQAAAAYVAVRRALRAAFTKIGDSGFR